MISGISQITPAHLDETQQKLFDVLDRKLPLDPLDALINAISSPSNRNAVLKDSAIGFDSSVFLRMVGNAKIADITDYLSTQHQAPVILPGQTIQEFWNNQLSAVDTMTTSAGKKFETFRIEAEKLDIGFSSFGKKMNDLISEYDDQYGHVYNEATVRSFSLLLQILKEKALVPHVHRLAFRAMAEQRKRAKTPPGFKDDGDGDFYVWADFLYGLLQAKEAGKEFTHAIMLTLDKKPDWSRKQVAHPILTAEMNALLGVKFEIWTIEDLQKAVEAQ